MTEKERRDMEERIVKILLDKTGTPREHAKRIVALIERRPA